MEPMVEEYPVFNAERILLLRRAVQCLLRNGVHQKELAQRAGIAPYQVRNFVKSRTDNPRPNIERAIRPIYECLAAYEQMVIPSECRELIQKVRAGGNKAVARATSWGQWIAEEIKLSAIDFRDLCKEYAGDYLCFRHSAWKGHIAVSALSIHDLDEGSVVARFRHIHATREGKQRSASGCIFPLSHALFFIGCMEGKIGVEAMVLMREERTLLNGLILLPSNRRSPIAANIACRSVGQVSQGDLGVFPKDDVFPRMTETEIRAISNQTEEGGVLHIY